MRDELQRSAKELMRGCVDASKIRAPRDFYMPASFTWRLTLASRRFTPKAPVRLRKPARRHKRRLQHNAAQRTA